VLGGHQFGAAETAVAAQLVGHERADRRCCLRIGPFGQWSPGKDLADDAPFALQLHQQHQVG
jgi:hypothetical protein